MLYFWKKINLAQNKNQTNDKRPFKLCDLPYDLCPKLFATITSENTRQKLKTQLDIAINDKSYKDEVMNQCKAMVEQIYNEFPSKTDVEMLEDEFKATQESMIEQYATLFSNNTKEKLTNYIKKLR